jgi:hypothetical protein
LGACPPHSVQVYIVFCLATRPCLLYVCCDVWFEV